MLYLHAPLWHILETLSHYSCFATSFSSVDTCFVGVLFCKLCAVAPGAWWGRITEVESLDCLHSNEIVQERALHSCLSACADHSKTQYIVISPVGLLELQSFLQETIDWFDTLIEAVWCVDMKLNKCPGGTQIFWILGYLNRNWLKNQCNFHR